MKSLVSFPLSKDESQLYPVEEFKLILVNILVIYLQEASIQPDDEIGTPRTEPT